MITLAYLDGSDRVIAVGYGATELEARADGDIALGEMSRVQQLAWRGTRALLPSEILHASCAGLRIVARADESELIAAGRMADAITKRPDVAS
jgi:hypothetical protein